MPLRQKRCYAVGHKLDTHCIISVFGSLDDCVVNLHFMLIFCQVSPPSCFPWLISPVTGASHDMSPTFVTVSRVTWSGHFVSRSMTATMIDTLCVTSEVSPTHISILCIDVFPRRWTLFIKMLKIILLRMGGRVALCWCPLSCLY